MKHFLNSLFLFVPLAIIIYIIMIVLWGEFVPAFFGKSMHKPGGHMHNRLSEIKHVKNIDILFLGSSHCYRGFDTRIFKKYGLSSFNLGSSSQTPIQTKHLLKRYLDKVNPKTVIYEVCPLAFSIDGVESALDIIANDKNDLESIKMAFKLKNIKVYNNLVYSFYRDIFKKSSFINEDIYYSTDRYINGGFVERSPQCYQQSKDVMKNSKLLPEQSNSFKELVEIIKDHNIRLILVQAPITKLRYNSYFKNKNFDSEMRRYGEYYNYNEIIKLNDSLHFYDSYHLNQIGVQIFNKNLIETSFCK